MKRQRGRNRGGGGGGGKQPQNANRAFDSNGPDGVKVRGNAQHVFEKYQQLARDATSSGDRVLAENYLQHAEHYFRLLRALQPQRPASEILGRDQFASGFDIDFEDEGAQAQAEAADEAAEAGVAAEGEPEAREGGRDRWQDRPREGRERDERRDRDRGGERFEGRNRDDREGGRERDGRDRDRGENREGGGRRERWRERDERRERERAERERGERGERDDRRDRFERDRQDRPEREPVAAMAQAEPDGPVLRDAEGGESQAPAFLQAAAPRADGDEAPAKRPRRRRAPRSFEAGEGAPPADSTEEV
jgi:hypothetical protein